jgi:tetratricopeptide (TPR) repeat protein
LASCCRRSGSTIATWQAIRATRARDDERQARQALDGALKQARANEEAAKQQRARAEANFGKVITAVTPLLLELHSKELSAVPGIDQAQRALADRAFQIFENLIDEQSSDPGVRLQSALAYVHLGYLLDTQRRSNDAMEASVKAVMILDRLATDFPADPVCRFQQARTHDVLGLRLYGSGRLEEAREEFRQATEHFERALELKPDARTFYSFAWFLARCPDTGFRDATKAVEFAERAAKLDPQQPVCWRILGLARYRERDWKGAVAAMQRATELSTQWSYHYFFLAMAHWELGNREQALEVFKRTADWTEKNYPDDHQESREFRTEAEKVLGIVLQQVPSEPRSD